MRYVVDHLTWVVLVMVFLMALFLAMPRTFGNETEVGAGGGPSWGLDAVNDVILMVAPRIDPLRRHRIAEAIVGASGRHNVDPLLVTAIAARESGFRRDIESGRVRGNLGEVGLMQIHGAALLFRPDDCSRNLPGVRCQIETGVAYLDYVRSVCGGSTTRWVAAYGWSRCPTEREAQNDRSTREARRLYRMFGGTGW